MICEMKWTPERRVYIRRLGAVSIFYVAAVAAVSWTVRRGYVEGQELRVAVSQIPVLGVAGMIWVMWRYFAEEPDEFFRLLLTRAVMAGAAVVLLVCTASAYLTEYAGFQPFPLMMVFPMFIFGWGAAYTFMVIRSKPGPEA